MRKIGLLCSCLSEAITVVGFEATRYGPEQLFMDVMFTTKRPYWRWRFEQAWRLLTGKDPYTSSVILEEAEIRTLYGYLDDLIRDSENAKKELQIESRPEHS